MTTSASAVCCLLLAIAANAANARSVVGRNYDLDAFLVDNLG